MSMNLACFAPDGKRIELFQTPTEITFKCLYTGNKENSWRTVLARYIYWLASSDWKGREELLLEHIEKLLSYEYLKFALT